MLMMIITITSIQESNQKITEMLMLRGADCMVPNNSNKESAFHYCGQSGNSEVRIHAFTKDLGVVPMFCANAPISCGRKRAMWRGEAKSSQKEIFSYFLMVRCCVK